MKLVLLQDWMDHAKGSELDLTDSYAKVLIGRGSAKEVKEQIEEVVEEVINDNEEKDVTEAPVDKMQKLARRK